MPRRSRVFASGFAVLALSFRVLAQTAGGSAGQVSAVASETRVSRLHGVSQFQIEAKPGTPLQWRDSVQTDHAGRARILLNDRSILSLGSDSQLRIEKHDAVAQQTELELIYGRIRCRVAKLLAKNGQFELRTTTSVAGVIGTDFGADASDTDQVKYVCIEGTVRISSLDRRSYVDCGPGMTVTIFKNKPLQQAVPATPVQLERWRHITEPGDPLFADTVNTPARK